MLRHHSQGRPHRLRQSLVLLLCAGLTANFAHHAMYGRHGLLARSKLLERESLLEFENSSLEAARAGLKRDVALLSPELPDPDIVEELARDVLGFVDPADRIHVIAEPN